MDLILHCSLWRQKWILKSSEPGVVVHTYKPNTWEAKVGGSQILRQLELYSETLSQKQTNKKTYHPGTSLSSRREAKRQVQNT
jgi:hypothetical protein